MYGRHQFQVRQIEVARSPDVSKFRQTLMRIYFISLERKFSVYGVSQILGGRRQNFYEANGFPIPPVPVFTAILKPFQTRSYYCTFICRLPLPTLRGTSINDVTHIWRIFVPLTLRYVKMGVVFYK